MTTPKANAYNLYKIVGLTAVYAFAASIFLTGVAQYVAGSAFILALFAGFGIFLPGYREVTRNRWPFLRAYSAMVAVYVLYVFGFAAFGKVGVEGWGIVLELTLTLVFAVSVAGFLFRAGKDLLKYLVVLSFFHASLLMLAAVVQVALSDKATGFRVAGDINAIIYAHFMMTSAGIFAVWLFQNARTTASVGKFVLLAVWLLAAIYATFLTGSRGAILAFFPILLGFMFIVRKDRPVRVRAVVLLAVPLVFLTLLIAFSSRTALGAAELAQSLDGQKNTGSVGLRLQFWKQAWLMIKAHPLAGNGLRFFYDIADLPQSSPMMAHKHAHNQFLDIWMKSGLPGVGLYLGLHGIPLVAGWRLIRSKADETLGLVLIWMTGSFFVYGLTDIFITGIGQITVYAIYVVALLILADRKVFPARTDS